MDSIFNTKYNEFVEDLFGALPEYTVQIQAAKEIDDASRLQQFRECVKIGNTSNPGVVLPGVEITDTVWNALSENTQNAILEHVRILSMCCLMESDKPEGIHESNDAMNDAMNELKKKMEGVDFQNIMKKFMNVLHPSGTSGTSETSGTSGTSETSGSNETGPTGFEKMFENGFPKIPEKFLKGHMAKLAQEIVKDITPEDLGISKEMMDECEKTPSRAFDILFKVFGNNPEIIQKTIQKIGKRLQEKIISGSIKPEEIAREAEELMKEFSDNSSFVNMMDGIKKAFGFEDMDIARKSGKEGTARMSIVKERLKKKMQQKEVKQTSTFTSSDVVKADAVMAALLRNEKKPKKKK